MLHILGKLHRTWSIGAECFSSVKVDGASASRTESSSVETLHPSLPSLHASSSGTVSP